jgi:hypothetical protein
MAKKKSKKIVSPKDESELEAGGTSRFQCSDCLVEFEVCYEPKAKETLVTPGSIESEVVEYCPFCGSDNIEPV